MGRQIRTPGKDLRLIEVTSLDQIHTKGIDHMIIAIIVGGILSILSRFLAATYGITRGPASAAQGNHAGRGSVYHPWQFTNGSHIT